MLLKLPIAYMSLSLWVRVPSPVKKKPTNSTMADAKQGKI